MEWSEDLGGLRLTMRREADSPQHIVLEFDVHDRELLKNKPQLKISATVQRLESKWQRLVSKEANRDTRIIFRGAIPIDTPRQTYAIKNQPFYDFEGKEIEIFCSAELGHSGATGEQRVPNPPPFEISSLVDASPITEPKDRIDESTNFARLPKQTKMLVYLQQALLAGGSLYREYGISFRPSSCWASYLTNTYACVPEISCFLEKMVCRVQSGNHPLLKSTLYDQRIGEAESTASAL